MNKEQAILKLENFFDCDVKIKKLLYNLALNDSDNYNSESIIKYADNLYETINYIEKIFLIISSDFNLDSKISQRINDIFNSYRKMFMKCNYDYNNLKKFYKTYISNMSKDLIDNTKRACVGYSAYIDIFGLLNQATTINEIIHIYHSYVTNNEKIYQSMNKLNKKQNKVGYEIALYGKKNYLSSMIYDNFPLNLDCGSTDIISLNESNKILMMIRDRGHALTIEIDVKDKEIKVNYFIPKLCNIEMINKLKGINRVSNDRKLFDGATGIFISDYDNILPDLFNFISMVPMDEDMIFVR